MNNTFARQESIVKVYSNKTAIIAAKEIADALKNNVFLVLLALLAGLVTISITISTLVFRGQVDQYQASLELLKSLGKTPATEAPQLFPLNLLRGTVDYIEIIGALLGIILGYLSIAKEKNTKTFSLILVRPVTRAQVVWGKLLGNYLIINGLTVTVGVVIWAALFFIGNVSLSSIELAKVFLFVLLAGFYLMAFFTLGLFLSLSQRNIVSGLAISLLIWLTFVLILPQIGDTMDPDNQVPGGFFVALNLDRPQEKLLMAKFNSYETIRTGLEQLSITKHFERASFALFGIKKEYNGVPLMHILSEKTHDFAFVAALLLVGCLACTSTFTRQKDHVW